MYCVVGSTAEWAHLSAIQLTNMKSPSTISQLYRPPIIKSMRLRIPGRLKSTASRATNAATAPARWR